MGVWRVAKGILEQEERWVASPCQPRGVPTGLAGLDALTHGLRPREVTLLAARTSHGKSALALTIAINVLKWEILRSLREGKRPGRVLYLSPEMHPEQLLMRLASAESRVDLEVIQDGIALPEQRRRWREALASLEPLDPYLIIEGGYGMDIDDVESSVRSLHAEHPLVLVVIDYLQRLSYGVVDDDYRRLSLISQTIKDLANETGIPFLVVSQLNRQIERDRHQGDRLPDLSDLRGSGRLEEDADNVWILWRPPKLSTESASAPQSAKLLVAKARSGKVGEVDLWFYPRIVSFVDSGAGKVRADGGLSLHSVAGEPLPTLVELALMMQQGRMGSEAHSREGGVDGGFQSPMTGGIGESCAVEESTAAPVAGGGIPQGTVAAPGDASSSHRPSQESLVIREEPVVDRATGNRGDILKRLDVLAAAFASWGSEETPKLGGAVGEPTVAGGSVGRLEGSVRRLREKGVAGRRLLVQSFGDSTDTSPAPCGAVETTPRLVLWNWFPEDGGGASVPEERRESGGRRGPPRGRRRGADFEKRLARRLGGYRWPGLDGDIEIPQGWRIECKYREGLVLDSRSELRYWLEQLYGYAKRWGPEKRWALALTGGRGYRKGAVYVLMPLEFWWELVCAT